mgnify:CR=1 FL=1
MGEALIIRSGGGSQSSGGYVPKTVLINSNQTWTVPKAKNQEFMVRLFGAGGTGYGDTQYDNPQTGHNMTRRTGGGGGNMNNAMLKLNVGEVITVSIGNISGYSGNGGTTSFGTYLSATGGEKSTERNGGNGGTGGGGFGKGGDGYYGGGGYGRIGGNGGIYGGGGGAASANAVGRSTGGYGNGGYFEATYNQYFWKFTPHIGEDGLNTINIADKIDFPGYGKAGSQNGGGGGGYGGNGGNNFGGGGGYGGDGGNGRAYTYSGLTICGGGGGGYGNNGANGTLGSDGIGDEYMCCGGGGGYGLEGYGHGGGTYGGGQGDYMSLQRPKPGVCIITYMEPVQ